jgi:hypothetical protein
VSVRNLDKLSERARSVLTTLCSNYRERMLVRANFRCSVYYGADKFQKEIERSLKAIKRAGFITSYRFADAETDPDTDLCYFDVYADMNMSVEEMAEVCVNSQTVFRQS